ncbi:MAG TPA: glycosyltransferase family 2 protein [Chitinophagaceae bacterium]|nr:glycosyltransferase family 2 protein [Chitinophagaceae bacterium]
MQQDLVSIIIPFYNEEQFLARAIRSALVQTYTNIEIILVNDGSTDGSMAIAEAFRQTEARIKLIDAEHHSQGKARNRGISAAEGRYVLFLDSDDELEHFAVASLLGRMEAEQADLVICKFALYDASGRLTKHIGWTVDGHPMNRSETIGALYRNRIVYMAGARLYHLDMVRKYPFPEGTWFEDTPFVLAYLLHAERVSFEEQICWKIHSRPGSITRRLIEPKRIYDSRTVFLYELSLLQTSADYNRMKSVFFTYHVQGLMRNLIFLCSDRARVADKEALQTSFEQCFADFKKQLDVAGCRLGPRTKVNLALLSLPRFSGWRFTFFIVPLLKRKQYRSIHVLRNT